MARRKRPTRKELEPGAERAAALWAERIVAGHRAFDARSNQALRDGIDAVEAALSRGEADDRALIDQTEFDGLPDVTFTPVDDAFLPGLSRWL